MHASACSQDLHSWTCWIECQPLARQVREAYERAIANVPPAPEKRFWQRYIYLWINYALWEELDARDSDRTREVYRACLKLIPHTTFTFAKVCLPCSGMHLYSCCVSGSHSCAGWCSHRHVHWSIDVSVAFRAAIGGFCICSVLHASLRVHAAQSSAQHAHAAQVWILAAQFEIRQLNLDKARTILGMALGICPKSKMFRAYVELETQLGSIERCRK